MADVLSRVSARGGRPLGLGLGAAYNNAGVRTRGSLVMDSRVLDRMASFGGMFAGGAREGVRQMLTSLMIEDGAEVMGLRKEGDSRVGPVVNKEMFNEKVLVPLLFVTSGLMLDTHQDACVKALLALVSVKHEPVELPMQDSIFMYRVIEHIQNLAVRGNFNTKTGSVVSASHDMTVELENFVVGFDLGDQEFAYNSDPNNVMEKIIEKMVSLEVSWALTLMNLHADYLSRMPTAAQRGLLADREHLPADDYGKLLRVVFDEVNTTGAVNRNLYTNVPLLLESAVRLLELNSDGYVLVTTEACAARMSEITARVDVVTGQDATVYYDTNNPSGINGVKLFGTASVDYLRARPAVEDSAPSGSNVRAGRHLNDFGEKASGNTITVDTIEAGGQRVYIIGVDGSDIDRQGTRCDAPLIEQAVRRSYVTVGGCPDLYKGLCRPSFFSADASGDYSPKKILEHSADTSYFVVQDTEVLGKISVRECNKTVVHADLFNIDAIGRAFDETFGDGGANVVNEAVAATMVGMSYREKCAQPEALLEFSPRQCFVRSDVDFPNHPYRKMVAANPAEYVYLVNREVLGNASPFSDFENEMVQSVGALHALYGGRMDNIRWYLDTCISKIQMLNVDTVLAVRAHTAATFVAALGVCQSFVKDDYVITDPICCALLLQAMDKAVVANPRANLDNAGTVLAGVTAEQTAEAALGVLYGTNKDYLWDLRTKIYGVFREVQDIVDSIVVNVNFNLLTMAQPLTDIPRELQRHAAAIKYAYCFLGPVYATHLSVDGAMRNALGWPNAMMNFASFPTSVLCLGDTPLGHNHNRRILFRNYNPRQIEVFRPVFNERIRLLKKRFATCPDVRFLAMAHYTMRITEDTMEAWMDVDYPSGMAYMVVRQATYEAHMGVCVPHKSVRLLMGDRGAAIPFTNFSNTRYMQAMELKLAPMSMGSLGVRFSGMYCDRVEGMGNERAITRPGALLVLDSYNSFLPDGKSVFQEGNAMLSVHGRFTPRGGIDPVTGLVTTLPTTFLRASPILTGLRRRYPEAPAVVLMVKALEEEDMFNVAPPMVKQLIRKGSVKNALDALTANAKPESSLLTSAMGLMLPDDYTVGRGSSRELRSSTIDRIDPEMCPRINAIGGLSANKLWSQNDGDHKVTTSYVKGTYNSRINSRIVTST